MNGGCAWSKIRYIEVEGSEKQYQDNYLEERYHSQVERSGRRLNLWLRRNRQAPVVHKELSGPLSRPTNIANTITITITVSVSAANAIVIAIAYSIIIGGGDISSHGGASRGC